MPDDKPIETSTYIAHEGMGNSLREFLDETGLDEAPQPVKELVAAAFNAGWGGCLQETLNPAKNLAMVMLQIMSLEEKVKGEKSSGDDKEDFKIVLRGQALEELRGLCNQVVGLPESWQLDEMVQPIQMEEPPDTRLGKQEEDG